MLVFWVAPIKRKDIGVIQIVSEACDEDIFGLLNQATKALSWPTRAVVANSSSQKSSNCLVISKASTAK